MLDRTKDRTARASVPKAVESPPAFLTERDDHLLGDVIDEAESLRRRLVEDRRERQRDDDPVEAMSEGVLETESQRRQGLASTSGNGQTEGPGLPIRSGPAPGTHLAAQLERAKGRPGVRRRIHPIVTRKRRHLPRCQTGDPQGCANLGLEVPRPANVRKLLPTTH